MRLRPRSSISARTLPTTGPAITLSPTVSVPSCTSTVATGPRPRSSFVSSTVPIALRFGLALRSSSSVTSSTISSSVSRPVFFFADTSTNTVCPPQSSGIKPRSVSWRFTVSGFAPGLVDLVDRDDDLHVRGLGVVDGFPGLRHHAVIGGHHQYHHVGDLRAACAHHRERGVTRRVQEHDAAAARRRHQVGADVLRDTAGFALGDTGLADRVEQRRLAVIDVAHDRDHRRPRDHVFRIGGFVALGDDFLFETAGFDLGAKTRGERLGGLEVDRRVDRHHQAAIEERLQRVLDADLETIRQVLHRHAFREGDGARDRRRRRGCLRLLRALQRLALLRGLETRRRPLLRTELLLPHRRLARPLRHAGARAHRLRRQWPRTAQHRCRVAGGRTRRSVGTLLLTRAGREVTGGLLRRARGSRRHRARRLRDDLPLRLQRRRARRRLAGFFDAQANAWRHEAAALFARRLGHRGLVGFRFAVEHRRFGGRRGRFGNRRGSHRRVHRRGRRFQ